MFKYCYSIIIFICCFSCKGNSNPYSVKESLPGTYFELKKDNMKLFLPSYFQEFSKDTYDALIDSLPESKEKEFERKRFDYLKYSKGNVYYFKDFASSTLIVVKMMKYLDFSKKDSSLLLGMLSQYYANYANKLNTNYKKITAGYSGNYKTKVFKAVYEIFKDSLYKSYTTLYIITSNNKTFSLNIYSKNHKDYNKFIEKIIIE